MQPDLAARLAQALHDREAAWTFVREFAEAWSAPLTDTDGTGNDELDAAEARLGVKLPRAVREAYLLFGRRPDLTSNQDRLLAPEKLFVDHGMLVFREENQWVAHWGVPLEALDQDDPPVTMWMSLADPAADPKTAWLDRFSVACVEMVLSESLFEPEDLAASMELDEDDAAALERWGTRLPLPDYPAGSTETRWFVGPDVLVRAHDRQWAWVRARTEEALDEFVDAPEEWLRR
ncbi:hypothetical protein [Umezawaea tangerina]|uniref:SMI1/KNR4 family protein SUKH-1 n=1 Tax=Umezawaea tangerina TaxID=84725 RepID=A0A2T0TDV8_9PSEU|nr:hypothetical protein [Umezawaea tangerina]PRY43855.1 hypothetical protein CLV43_103604 [Umezawaea tangerina]